MQIGTCNAKSSSLQSFFPDSAPRPRLVLADDVMPSVGRRGAVLVANQHAGLHKDPLVCLQIGDFLLREPRLYRGMGWNGEIRPPITAPLSKSRRRERRAAKRIKGRERECIVASGPNQIDQKLLHFRVHMICQTSLDHDTVICREAKLPAGR